MLYKRRAPPSPPSSSSPSLPWLIGIGFSTTWDLAFFSRQQMYSWSSQLIKTQLGCSYCSFPHYASVKVWILTLQEEECHKHTCKKQGGAWQMNGENGFTKLPKLWICASRVSFRSKKFGPSKFLASDKFQSGSTLAPFASAWLRYLQQEGLWSYFSENTWHLIVHLASKHQWKQSCVKIWKKGKVNGCSIPVNGGYIPLNGGYMTDQGGFKLRGMC